jgi:quercetin dioxygenase-like cupin family protein
MSAEPAPNKVLLRGEQSGSVVSVIESGSLPGYGGPPLHHHDFDETFYVIEGELTFQLGDELLRAKAGEIAFAPRGVPHTYANLSDAPTRHLIACTPAGFERYFARMAAERRREKPPEWALQPIPGPTTVVKDPRLAPGRRSWSSAKSKRFRSWSSRGWSMSSGSRSTRLRPVSAGLSSTVASQRWNSSFRRRVAVPQARSLSSTKTRIAPSEYRPGHRIRRPQATAGAVRTLPRLLMIDLNATIVNVASPSIQEHLGYSRTRVAVGCAGSMS